MPQSIPQIFRVILLVWPALIAAAGCGRAAGPDVPVAKPQVTLSSADGIIGGPLEMKYQFVVAPDAPPFNDDYWVFVHFVDTDGELMWTDDHEPPTPVRQWKPGQTITYDRTMFVPKFPYVGETRVEVGIYSRKTGNRLPLEGATTGQRAYQLAKFNLQLQADSLFVVFRDGWHPTELAESSAREWQWSKKQATFAFRNPHRDALLYLQLDRAGGFPEPQQVELRIANDIIDSFSLAPNQAELRKIPLTAAQLGPDESVEVQLSVDKTFIPATVPELKNNDPRELGIRVFRAFVESK